MEKLDFESLETAINVMQKMWDEVRLVDPFRKQAGLLQNRNIDRSNLSDSTCYVLWREDKTCTNCVAARALIEDVAFVKIETNGNRIFMVNAIPIIVESERVVLELIRDITDHGIIDLGTGHLDTDDVHQIVNRKNEAIVTDDLTGIYNRRYIFERLPVDILKSIADKTPLAIFMADVDEFKHINDCHGHVAGDHALRSFAKVLQNSVRKDKDWVARYGGDEFLIVLLATDRENAYKITERMRRTVEATPVRYENQTFSITGSFGGYILEGQSMTIEDLVATADKQLYRAKQEGRNRVAIDEAPGECHLERKRTDTANTYRNMV